MDPKNWTKVYMMKTTLILLTSVLAILLSACTRTEPPTELAPQRPVTKSYKEVLAFAERIAKSINKADPSVLDEAFDRETLVTRAAYGTSDSMSIIRTLLADTTLATNHLGELIMAPMSLGTRCILLGVVWNDHKPRAFYRIHDSHGINYLELMIGQDSLD